MPECCEFSRRQTQYLQPAHCRLKILCPSSPALQDRKEKKTKLDLRGVPRIYSSPKNRCRISDSPLHRTSRITHHTPQVASHTLRLPSFTCYPRRRNNPLACILFTIACLTCFCHYWINNFFPFRPITDCLVHLPGHRPAATSTK